MIAIRSLALNGVATVALYYIRPLVNVFLWVTKGKVTQQPIASANQCPAPAATCLNLSIFISSIMSLAEISRLRNKNSFYIIIKYRRGRYFLFLPEPHRLFIIDS